MAIPPHEIPKGNILIVDDTPENLHLLSSTLTERGYEVRGVVDGAMAVRVAHAAPPNLILLDIKMPGINGYEVCQQLKASEQTCDIPVIFLSVLDDTWDKVKAFAVGGCDYIGKPFHAEEVIARIENQLRLQAAKAEICTLNAELEHRVQQRTEQLEAANQLLRKEIDQRQRAEEALCQQARQKELVVGIAQRIRQSLNLATILNTTVSEIQQFLQVDRVVIYRFEPDWSGIVVVEAVADTQFSILGRTITDHYFTGDNVKTYCQGRIQSVADIYTADLTPCHVDLLAALQIRANLVVPIVQEERLWGLLIANHCTQPRSWTALEIDLMRQLSTQLAIALQQSELYHQVQQLNANLEEQVQERTDQLRQARGFDALLKRITDKVRDNLDENQILQTAVQELALGLQVVSCATTLYDLEQQTATIGYEYTTATSKKQGTVQRMADHSEIYYQLLHRQWFQLCKPQSVGGWSSLLACPVFDDQGVLGDLWLSRIKEAVFTEQEIQLVQHVATQCAIALRQARLYAAAQTQVEALESLNQMKDEFLSTVSHELRSPVTTMKMAIKMLKTTLSCTDSKLTDSKLADSKLTEPAAIVATAPLENTTKINQYLQILDNECEREISLINDLLDLQRIEGNSQPLITQTIDLNLWLPTFLNSFQERATARKQTFLIALPDQLPLMVSDLDALERILTELLHNACKYTPPGERIAVGVEAEPNTIHIQITNFGVEIPTEELPHIFEKFYRITHLDRWKQGGTGLGLALVKKLVEHLGSTIDVCSTDGKTTFALSLPRIL